MAWGNKKSREAEYLRTGQSAALRPGDLGAKDIYDLDGADEREDEFDLPWSPRPTFEGLDELSDFNRPSEPAELEQSLETMNPASPVNPRELDDLRKSE